MFDWWRRLFSRLGVTVEHPAMRQMAQEQAVKRDMQPVGRVTSRENGTTVTRRGLQAGRQTKPSNVLANFGWNAVPRRAGHAVDVSTIDVRKYSAQQLLELLADVSPDVSLALWNVLRIAGGEFRLKATRVDGAEVDESAQTALDELIGQIGRQHGGLESLIDQFHLTLFLQGAAAGELVLAKSLKNIEDMIAVQPYTITFKRDEQKIPRPHGEDDHGQLKPLNENLFWYVALDAPPDDPYGRAPSAPAIGEIMFGIQMLVDLKRAVHTNAWGRLDVSVVFEMLQNAAPMAVKNDQAALWAWINERLTDIQSQYNALEPDDTFVHLDLVKVAGVDSSGKTLQIAPLIRVLELRTIRALKQLPVLMGSNEGTTETHGTVQYEIYAKGIRAIRMKSDFLLEQMLTTALNVLGVQANVEMEWEDLRTTDRKADAEAEEIEIRNEIAKVNQGWQTNDDAAQAIVGHEAVGEPAPPPSPTPDDVEEDDYDDEDDRSVFPKRLTMRQARDNGDAESFAQMTAAERRALSACRVAMRAYFRKLGREFPVEDIAREVVEEEEALGRNSRAAEPDDLARLARIRRIIEAWFVGEDGQTLSGELRELLEREYIRVWNVEGARGLRELGIQGSFELRNEAVIDGLRRTGAERVTGIDEFSQRRLANVIANSLAEGNGVDQIAKDIRAEFSDWTRGRAVRIAHTETGDMMSRASLEFFQRNEVPKKAWLTVNDARVEPECLANQADGEIPIDQAFSSGAMRPLQHPNCRCVLKGVVSDEWEPPSEPWRGE